MLPGGRAVPKILYSAKGSDVLTSIVDGRILMENRVVLSVDEDAVIRRAGKLRAELIEMGGAETEKLLNAPWPDKGASWRFPDG